MIKTVPASYPVFIPSPAATLGTIEQAEAMGVPAIWGPTIPMGFDMLTLLAAAAVRTTTMRLGVAIVPTYPRSPVELATEALVLAELAPGRFCLGLGTSHPAIIEGMYGLPFGRKPVSQLREYITILRALLWEGQVTFEGEFYQVNTQFPSGTKPPCIPLPIAALRPPLFRLAGEVSDGALAAWCPYNYLVDVALPTMREGAASANRPVPPVFAQVPVVLSEDFNVVREAAQQALDMYLHTAPAYARLFAMAGYPIGSDCVLPDNFIQDMFVYGDDAAILARLGEIRAMGIDELMVTLHPVGDPMAEQTHLLGLIAAFNRQN